MLFHCTEQVLWRLKRCLRTPPAKIPSTDCNSALRNPLTPVQFGDRIFIVQALQNNTDLFLRRMTLVRRATGSFTVFSADSCGPGFCLILTPPQSYDEPILSLSKTPQKVSRTLTGYSTHRQRAADRRAVAGVRRRRINYDQERRAARVGRICNLNRITSVKAISRYLDKAFKFA